MTHASRSWGVFAFLLPTLLSTLCVAVFRFPLATGQSVNLGKPTRMVSEHLPNAVRLNPDVISGGQPDGDEGFAELRELGVKTIISVDGATPEIEAAREQGLRYVHLPHGYDGVPHRRAQELAKAVQQLERPIYIHCHHGKHRSPAAAAVACVTAGMLAPARALDVLELAGTSRSYRGLYKSVNAATPVPRPELDRLKVNFVEIAKVAPMAESMVDLGHTFEHVEMIRDSGWQTPEEHPDLDPAHEMLLLKEHFTELLRNDQVQQQASGFQHLLRSSEQQAERLRVGVRRLQSVPHGNASMRRLSEILDRIESQCKQCHQRYRDTPLSEKRRK